MFHRIITEPKTHSNDTWGSLSSLAKIVPPKKYVDPIISSNKTPTTVSNGLSIAQALSDNEEYKKIYQKIAIDIITETVFDYRYPTTSEKTFRPLSARKIFIIVGPAGSVDRLHKIGFLTFAPFIDESYDSIQDPVVRITKIINEIDRIASIPLDKIKQQMLEYKDRLDHNQKLLRKIYDDRINEIRRQLCSK